MEMEIPVDLINQFKISLRREAKLLSYDLGGASFGESLPSLPSAADAIAELDASAVHPRCRNCKGKLMRGAESLICVFCGKQQRTSDNPPDPIKFTSTSGYKWLLSSLNLNGSEIVMPPKEMNGSGRGKNTPMAGISVSKHLDLEIQWCALEEKSANSGTRGGKSLESKIPFNLGGFDVDEFFIEGRGDLSKAEVAESKPVNDDIPDDDFKDLRSLSSSDKVKSQGSSELYQHGNVSLFEGTDAPKKHENLSLFEGQDSQESVSIKEDKNLSLFDGNDDPKTSSEVDPDLDLFKAGPLSNADAKSVDSSSVWDLDFPSATQNHAQEQKPRDLFADSSIDLSAHMDSVFGSGKDVSIAKPEASTNASMTDTADWIHDDLFGNVKVEKNESAEVMLEKNGTSSMSIDWIGDDLWQNNNKKDSNKIPIEEEDEDWNDFASSANLNAPNPAASFQEETFDGMVKNDERSTEPGTTTNNQDDDIFGAWNSFTASQVPQQDSSNLAGHTSEINLSGEQANDHHQGFDFGSFSSSDIFSGGFNRMGDTAGKDQIQADPNPIDQSLKSKADVAEELMSQMHDLSFMLENKLSLPPNSK